MQDHDKELEIPSKLPIFDHKLLSILHSIGLRTKLVHILPNILSLPLPQNILLIPLIRLNFLSPHNLLLLKSLNHQVSFFPVISSDNLFSEFLLQLEDLLVLDLVAFVLFLDLAVKFVHLG